MKILFLNSPWINNEKEYGIKSGTRWAAIRKKGQSMPYFPFPYFMALNKTLLCHLGFDAYIKDAIAEELSKTQCLDYIKELNPGIIIIEAFTPSINVDLEFAESVKRGVDCKVIFTGAHSTALPKEVLTNTHVDFVLLGDCFSGLKQLCGKIINKDDDFSDVSGVAYKRDGTVVVNPAVNDPMDLNEVVYPDRDGLPVKKYNEPLCKNYPNARIVTSMGCPYKCIFCVEPLMYGGNYRLRLIDNVIAEIKMLKEKYRIKEIVFDDSLFTIQRARQIAQAIIDNNIKISWICWIDWNISFEDLKLIKDSGCVAVKFGVESADFEKVKLIGKNLQPEKLKQLIGNCKKLGIVSHASFMLGLPGETKQSLQDTIDFSLSLGLNSVQFTIATPLPGTPFYEMASANGWLDTNDWSRFDSLQSCVLKYPECSPEDVVEAINRLRRRKIRMFLSNPFLAVNYIWKLYRLKGFKGFIMDIISKSKFIFRTILGVK